MEDSFLSPRLRKSFSWRSYTPNTENLGKLKPHFSQKRLRRFHFFQKERCLELNSRRGLSGGWSRDVLTQGVVEYEK
jgi:hypothetical protein